MKLRPKPSIDPGPFGTLMCVGSTPAARADLDSPTSSITTTAMVRAILRMGWTIVVVSMATILGDYSLRVNNIFIPQIVLGPAAEARVMGGAHPYQLNIMCKMLNLRLARQGLPGPFC